MGLRGPPPTPTAILAARGSWRAGKRSGEPQPQKGRPKKPKLGKDASRLWSALTKELSDLGVLTTIDGGQLERYCVYFVRWRQTEAVLEKFGGDKLGASLLNEQSRILYKQATIESHRLNGALHAIEVQFGLTPAARTRLVNIASGEGGDELDAFLKVTG